MSNKSLQDFNRLRKKEHYKDESQENYLLDLNKVLQEKEIEKYLDLEEEYPSIFVFGLPRSGTTFMTQLIAHSFNIGYINNFMARFWLAPVTGIKLSNIIYGQESNAYFDSDYASTKSMTDIHEFGYFWRNWLKKDSIPEIIRSKENEEIIDWAGLKKCILNIHNAFGKAWICKNIFGAYHIEKLSQLLKKSLFVYIERDPLDNAISILDARKKFYSDINLWWSTVPYEYEDLKDLPVMEQITGQVHYLREFYANELSKLPDNRYMIIDYKDVTTSPYNTVEKIKDKLDQLTSYDNELLGNARMISSENVIFRTYKNRDSEKHIFNILLNRFR